MPIRMLRDWTRSEKVDSLSSNAEVFFTRLIMKADDYGCLYADPRLLKADLYPLRTDKVREADLLRWMAECQKAGLIVLYDADGKKYLQIVDFKQRLDKHKQRFPMPPENQSLTIVLDAVLERETETERETEKEERKPRHPSLEEVEEYFRQNGYQNGAKAWNYYNTAGWKDSKGNKVRNWKQKMISVWFRDENKIKAVTEITKKVFV